MLFNKQQINEQASPDTAEVVTVPEEPIPQNTDPSAVTQDAKDAGNLPDREIEFSLNKKRECIVEAEGTLALQLYDPQTEQYLNPDCLVLKSNVLTPQVFCELLSLTDDTVQAERLRVCVSLDGGHAFHLLRLKDYAETKHPRILCLIPENESVIDTSSPGVFISNSGYLSVSAADLLISFQKTLLQTDIAAFPASTRILIEDLQTEPALKKCYFGLYDKKTKEFFLHPERSRFLSLKDLGLLYKQVKPKLKSPKLLLCLLTQDETPALRPLSSGTLEECEVQHLYDSMIMMGNPDKHDLVTLVAAAQNGTVFLQKIPAEEKEKYHSFTEQDILPDWCDPEFFHLIDSRTYVNSPDSFFRAVGHYLEILKNADAHPAHEIYWAKKRMLFNLNAMVLSARELPGFIKKDEPSYEQEWKDVETLLSYIEDDLIQNALISRYSKLFFMGIKYKQDYSPEEYISDTGVCYGKEELYKISDLIMRIDILEVRKKTFLIEGFCTFPEAIMKKNPQLAVYVNNRLTPHESVYRYHERYVFQKLFTDTGAFKLELPLPKDQPCSLRIGIRIDGFVNMCSHLTYGEMMPIGTELKNGYYFKNGYLFQAFPNRITCRKSSKKEHLQCERKLRSEIKMNYPDKADKIIALRDCYRRSRSTKQEQQWLFIERPDRADDNAEALFKYVCSHPIEHVKPVFIICKYAEGFRRLQQFGTVYDFRSDEHLQAFLTSDYIISSQLSPSILNPFNEDFIFFRDMIRARKYIFLQHGVTANDNGKAFSHYRRNYDGIVTSSERERDYLLLSYLHNDPDTLWLTGMPRFDYLQDKHEKIITIMPTWRYYLTHRVYSEALQTMIWKIVDSFTESEFYRFYNSLINDPRLISLAREHGYKIKLMLHPQFLKAGPLFHNSAPDTVKICDYERSYQDVYAESALVMTDYTSAVFDFAYMKKPVVYCQFDKNVFYSNHTVKPGYFDFEKDGFGEVVYTLEDAVKLLTDYIRTDCALKEKYRERIENFFAFSDRNCCQRVCQHLLGQTDDSE